MDAALAKKDDDLYEDVELGYTEELGVEEEVPPDQFVREIYEIAAKRYQRGTGGIYPSDLLYDMIPYSLESSGEVVWWMSQMHPIALMLVENDVNSDGLYEELGSMKSSLGKIIIYTDDMVKECRDCLIAMCHSFDLKILEEPQEIVIEKNE